MFKVKKIFALAISALLLVSLLASCGTTSSSSASAGGSASGGAGEPVEITLGLWSIGAALPENTVDELRDYVFEKLNIRIIPVELTWDDYEQKIPLMATSGQLPDMFAFDLVGRAIMPSWVDQEIIKPLPDDMSKYPNLQGILEDTAFSNYKYPYGSDDAKFYGVPRINYREMDWVSNDYGIIVRKDWMEKLGKKEPTTFDEFIDLMAAFANEDPDGNGSKDTIGYTPFNQDSMGLLMNAFEPGLTAGGGKAVWVRDKANPGQWVPSFMTPDALEGYKAIAKLNEAGGLDPDFAVIKGEEGLDKLVNGKAGALGYGGNYGSLWKVYDKFNQVSDATFEDTFMVLKPFKNYKDGNYYRYIQNGAWSETYFNADISPEKLDKGLQLLDFFLSEEGYRYTHFGMKDKDWKEVGDTIELIPTKDGEGKAIAVTTLYPFSKMNSLAEWSGSGAYLYPQTFPNIQAMAIESRDWLIANAKPIETDLRMGLLVYDGKEKDSASFKDDVAKIVLSGNVEKTFNEVVDNYKKTAYNDIIQKVNELAEKYSIK